MPVPTVKQKLQHFEANAQGRDFVVGDIHGCFEALMVMLKLLNFDFTKDRLFSVGDLIDRGPDSIKCVNLIYEPWFFPVVANHEQMMIDTLVTQIGDRYMWLSNGGNWMLDHDRTMLTDIATDLQMLPYVISVGQGDDRFNIVHAELIRLDSNGVRIKVTNEMIDRWDFGDDEEEAMLWGRDIIQNGYPIFPPPDELLWHDLDKMSLTFVGHTPIREPVICQRQMYLDGGCVYHYIKKGISETNTLIIAEPHSKLVHKYIPLHNTVHTCTFNEIEQLS